MGFGDLKGYDFKVYLILIVKTLLWGIAVGEVCRIGKIIYGKYKHTLVEVNSWLIFFEIAIFLAVILFISSRAINLKKYLSKDIRVDLLVFLYVGFKATDYTTIFYHNFIIDFFKNLSVSQVEYLVWAFKIGFIFISIREALIIFLEKPKKNSSFISDQAICKEQEDILGFKDKAYKFAENVYDNGSEKGTVFGIDAPWGSGKSSFIEMSINWWKKEHEDDVIIYKFDLVKYQDKENILEKFVAGLICEIDKKVFVPEFKSIISKYSKILRKSNMKISIMGLNFIIPLKQQSVMDLMENIEKCLLKINKKIIVIIDDLDRLNYSAMKETLFVIKNAFNFSAISFVVCYDTEKLSDYEDESDKDNIVEFLEKYIKIKLRFLSIEKTC